MPFLQFTRQQLRHTACMALFAWAFALLSGVANACLIHSTAPGAASFGLSQGDRKIESATGGAPGDRLFEQAHHHVDDESGGPNEGGGKAGCLKFCADESSAQVKSKVSQLDLAGSVVLASIAWPLATRVAVTAPRQAVERLAAVGPPLFLRSLRLTI